MFKEVTTASISTANISWPCGMSSWQGWGGESSLFRPWMTLPHATVVLLPAPVSLRDWPSSVQPLFLRGVQCISGCYCVVTFLHLGHCGAWGIGAWLPLLFSFRTSHPNPTLSRRFSTDHQHEQQEQHQRRGRRRRPRGRS